ncbi:helix-turn-helix transcriptional regulator [Hyphomicrobium sp. 99]|uniref:ArsR/SmtB family transcription factor n=1 Tax=Hyphomicrobium sp. 99 TaxID=1163419 RepID=UPI0005F81062|nr:metalloregulator ArsR/SmtB family transcription factor [Hyphomicrobium sp. 99]
MNKRQAVTSLAALAHEQRLGIFRLLVRKGPTGLPAGAIASAIGASPTAASFHLKELDRAGLIRSTRQGRSIVYALHVDAVRQLLTYLTEDCCQGHPEMCAAPTKAAKNFCRVEGEGK